MPGRSRRFGSAPPPVVAGPDELVFARLFLFPDPLEVVAGPGECIFARHYRKQCCGRKRRVFAPDRKVFPVGFVFLRCASAFVFVEGLRAVAAFGLPNRETAK